MKRLVVMILAVVISIVAWSPVWADSITLQYTEPTLSADGTPLQDLTITSAFCDVHPDGVPASRMDIPATAPTGGNTVIVPFDLTPSSFPASVECWATATDTFGNESARSVIVSVPLVDGPVGDTTPPDAPSDVNIIVAP